MAATSHTGELLDSFKKLKADGSTACGCWIYCGIYPQEHLNKANQREPEDHSGTAGDSPGRTTFASSITAARRVPTASRGANARNSSGGTKRSSEWTGHDVPDFDKNKAPDYRPPPGAKGMDAIAGDKPFVLHPDGVGWLFVTSGLKDGPLPTHYEPLETPFGNPLYPERVYNPAADRKQRPDNPYARFGRRALSACADDVSSNRASHRRRHVAAALASGGIAARALLRGLA